MGRVRLAVTLGDPRGIGAEVVAGALHDPTLASAADFHLIGPAGELVGLAVEPVGEWTAGASAAEAGRIAGLAIARGVELALAGEVDGLVTAPIEKGAFREAGFAYPGHTEMLQALCGVPAVAMLMTAEKTRFGGAPLRVTLATTHLPLRSVPEALTTELIVEQTRLTADALKEWWGVERPVLALCAFNPHASDGGLFGDEEARIYAPALRRLAEAGYDARGPIPADTVFRRALEGEFHAVVAPYHDVGMAAFKTAAFGGGVNVTLGLPFPRTSPDHGTALDIAGRGIADASSMAEAIRLAIALSTRTRAAAAG